MRYETKAPGNPLQPIPYSPLAQRKVVLATVGNAGPGAPHAVVGTFLAAKMASEVTGVAVSLVMSGK